MGSKATVGRMPVESRAAVRCVRARRRLGAPVRVSARTGVPHTLRPQRTVVKFGGWARCNPVSTPVISVYFGLGFLRYSCRGAADESAETDPNVRVLPGGPY